MRFPSLTMICSTAIFFLLLDVCYAIPVLVHMKSAWVRGNDMLPVTCAAARRSMLAEVMRASCRSAVLSRIMKWGCEYLQLDDCTILLTWSM